MSLDYLLGLVYLVIGFVAAALCVMNRSPFFLVSIIVMAAGQVVMNTATSAAANKESRDILKAMREPSSNKT